MGLIAQLEIVFSADVLISPARFRCSVKTTQACRGPRGHGLRRPSAVRTAPFAKGGKPGWLLQCRLGCWESGDGTGVLGLGTERTAVLSRAEARCDEASRASVAGAS